MLSEQRTTYSEKNTFFYLMSNFTKNSRVPYKEPQVNLASQGADPSHTLTRQLPEQH